MGGSSTSYVVSSTTTAIFDPKSRVDNFQAAMLDYVANSTIELYEYMKIFYTTPRLHDIRTLLKWCEDSGYFNHMGRVTATFYNTDSMDLDKIGEILKPYINVPDGASFQVTSANIGFFSTEAWLKHLANQQGKADLFYDATSNSCTVEFPSNGTIKATFTNGTVVEGALPQYSQSTRFIEIEYSLMNPSDVPTTDVDGNEVLDPETGEPVMGTQYAYAYGYYDYMEGSGIEEFEKILTEGSSYVGNTTYYPAIPVRTNTHWFYDTDAKYIGLILQKLHLYDKDEDPTKSYNKFCNSIASGIQGGSLGDVDYMTILTGCSINSAHPVDSSYIYTFFKKLYEGYKARFPQKTSRGIFSKSLKDLINNALNLALGGGFVINNGRSNLNLTYSWRSCFDGDFNGKWKPDAKIGSHGVLAGAVSKTVIEVVPARSEGGNYIYKWNAETGVNELQYESKPVTTTYKALLFCYQESEDHIQYVAFVNLKLINLVYHGETVNTNAYDSFINDTSKLGTVTLATDDINFGTFRYVEYQGTASAFVVPLEDTSFKAMSIKDQLDLTYGCTYIVINCWEEVEEDDGWGIGDLVGAFVKGVIGFSIGVILAPVAPMISTLAFAYATIAFTTVALAVAHKILCTIFGERIGSLIYNIIIKVIKTVLLVVASYAFKIPVIGWIVWAICMAAYTCITISEYLRAGYSYQDALKKGLIESSIAAIGTAAGAYVGGAAGAGISSGSAAAGESISSGESVGVALERGVIAGVGTYVGGAVGGVTGKALGAAIQGMGNSLVSGGNFKDSLTAGAISLGSSLLGSAFNYGYKNVSNALGFNKAVSNAGASVSTTNSNIQDIAKVGAITGSEFSFFGETFETPTTPGGAVLVAGQMLSHAAYKAFTDTFTNPMTYGSLLNMTLAEKQYHKMANLIDDYQEFNNRLKAVNDAIGMLNDINNSTITAEFLCKLQAALGRFSDLFPESSVNDPEEWLESATTTGHDQLKSVLMGPSTFAEAKLTLDGYEPYQLYYTQRDFGATFTEDPYLPYL